MSPPIRLLHQTVRPFVAAGLRGGIPTPLTAAVPTDAPVGVVPGPDPDRILALGGIGGSGVGLRTHTEGVAAQSARALAALTGRGVEWRTVPLADQHLTATQEAVRQITELHRYDVVLVMPGVADALELARITPWVHRLEDLLDHLVEQTADNSTVLVSDVPQVSQYVEAGSFVRGLFRDHAMYLSQRKAEVCARFPQVASVKLPDAGPVDFEGGEFRYASMYRRWGEHVGRVIADLQAERGGV
ncbi:SGNH/GDSL hydrolase family protein [Clavibacter capsici]|uniref:hypothetical protein n=1 Tax=Clavibacter capsici TaxID=1874630 RepID=UPI001428104E|nr:hypothetical protein [Clavibacter capsici]QIS43161.1 hypothetical protein GW571_14005 [Clavibacter capsici]